MMKTTTKTIITQTVTPQLNKKALMIHGAAYSVLFAGWLALQLQK